MPRFTAPTTPINPFRPLGSLDVDGGTPLRRMLTDYQDYLGSGWTATAVLDGKPYRLRAGGVGGPRSKACPGLAGCYARSPEGAVYEVVVPVSTPVPAPLDSDVTLLMAPWEELEPYRVPGPGSAEWDHR